MSVTHRNHNLYILGAGFSYDGGLPLISNFLDTMRENEDRIATKGSASESEALRKVFEFRHRAASAAYYSSIDVENIEELFSLASASERDSDDDYVPRAISATLHHCATPVDKTPYYQATIKTSEFTPPPSWQQPYSDGQASEIGLQRIYNIPAYDFYAGILSGKLCQEVEGIRNTVITFNYDTLLEEALNRLQVPFSYQLPLNGAEYHSSAKQIGGALADPSAMRILKPHGSMNWALNRISQSESNITVYSNYSELIADRKQPYLLPPTWRKVFAGALGPMLTQAVESIAEATRIIIIGFSMPPTDIYFKYLMAAGLKDNISLRDIIFINFGDCSVLQQNARNVFQPVLHNRIHWVTGGVKQALYDGALSQRINRTLTKSFVNLSSYN